MSEEKKYLVNVGGERIEVGAPDFYERAETLAVSYKESRDQVVRGEILAKLLELCRPILKAWKISDEMDREDYEQDCFFLLDMALAAFDPKKGNFVIWFKRYVQGRQNKIWKKEEQEIPTDFNSEETQDLLPTVSQEEHFSDDLGRTERLIGKERMELIKMRLLDGMTKDEIAKETGISLNTLRKRLARAYNAIRAGIILKSGLDSAIAYDDDGGTFVKPQQLAALMNISRDKLYRWSRDGYPTRYRIDPLHIIEFGGTLRYRLKFEGGKMLSPRVIIRKEYTKVAKAKYFSRAARAERLRAEAESRATPKPE